PVVLDHHAALGDPGGAAGFKYIDRFSGVSLGHPAIDRSAAEPVVLEQRKFFQIVKALDVAQRIEIEFGLLAEPKRAAGSFVEMPPDRFDSVRIEPLTGGRSLLGNFFRDQV